MAKTSYITIDGMMIGEITSSIMRNYGTDALGRVVETVNNGVSENSYSYKPYGGVLAKIGAAVDPSFLWNGGSGYRASKLTNSEYYFDSRIYSSSSAQWTSANPRWPDEIAYAYNAGSPNSSPGLGGISDCSADLIAEILGDLCSSVPPPTQTATSLCAAMLGCTCSVAGQANVTANLIVTCGKTTCAAYINQVCPAFEFTVRRTCPTGTTCAPATVSKGRVGVVKGSLSIGNPLGCTAVGYGYYRETFGVTLVCACLPTKKKVGPS